MSAQQTNDGGGNMSSAPVDGFRKRARDEEKAQANVQIGASGSSSVDARATKQPKLDHATQAADHPKALETPDASEGGLVPVHADAAAPLGSASQDPHAQPSAMLRCLTLCRDLQFSLMQLLELKDLARLDASCRSWRAWMMHPPLLAGLSFELTGLWFRLQPMLRSRWLPQLLVKVTQRMFSFSGESQLRFSRGSLQEQQQQCSLMLQTLPRCTQLRELVLETRDVPQADLAACFNGLADTLRLFCIRTRGPDAQLLPSLFSSFHPLRSLETLVVIGEDITPALDFSALPLMTRLSSFGLSRGTENKRPWRCSPEQVQCLAQSRSLTSLHCGSWSPDEREVDDAGQPLPNADQQVAQGIGALVSGWLDSPAAAASSAAAPRISILRDLPLEWTWMTPAVWSHVSRLTSLTELEPAGWSEHLSPADWAKLADFSQLRSLSLSNCRGQTLVCEAFHPALLRCTQLMSLCLSEICISREHLRALCVGLPLLSTLKLSEVQLEDCAPLALAPKLSTLQLIACSGLDGAPVQFRSALPAMAQLTHLTIHDVWGQMLSIRQAAPLSDALLARMPKLTPNNFRQTVRPADHEPAAAPLPAAAPAQHPPADAAPLPHA